MPVARARGPQGPQTILAPASHHAAMISASRSRAGPPESRVIRRCRPAAAARVSGRGGSQWQPQ